MNTNRMTQTGYGGGSNETNEQLQREIASISKKLEDRESELFRTKVLLDEYKSLYHELLKSSTKQERKEKDGVHHGYGIEQYQDEQAFRSLTLKQHAALQMMLRGASNREIAERFHVAEPTAKVYVRAIFKKFDVHDRGEVVLKALPIFRNLSDEEYRSIAGLPKDWDETFDGSDKTTADIRRRKGGEE